MTSLSVSPAALEIMARQLEEFGRDVQVASGYADRYSTMSWYDQGALQAMFVSHDEARASVQSALSQLKTSLMTSADAVADAARYYATTDTAAATAFDEKYGQHTTSPYAGYGHHIYVSGLHPQPTGSLVEPPPIPDDAMHGNLDITSLVSYLSLTNDLNSLISALIGVDVLGRVSQLLLGDWDSFARWAVALENLASFDERLALNLAEDLMPVRESWQGAAGTEAVNYFYRVDLAVGSQAEVLRGLSKTYLGISFAINLATQQLKGLLGALVDKLIIAAVSAAVGTATVETGVGAVIGYGVAIWQIMEALELWNKAVTLIQTASYVITGAVPAVIALTDSLNTSPKTPLPQVPYQHPALRSPGKQP